MIQTHAMADPQDLVLGLVHGIPIEELRPFFTSLRRSGYDGTVGLIVANYKAEDLRILDRYAQFMLVVDHRFARPGLSSVALKSLRESRRLGRAYRPAFELAVKWSWERSARSRWESLEFHLEGLVSLRHEFYLELLLTQALHAERILLTDVRDVIFQRNPFEDDVLGLELYLEDPSSLLSDGGYNEEWLVNLYGRQWVAEHGSRVVSCAGTTIGTRAAILQYLWAMSREISSHWSPLGYRDQAVHNYLLYSAGFPGAKVVANGNGRTQTMGRMADITRDVAGTVLNSDGSVPAILHQYDRHPQLAKDLVRCTRS